MCGKRVDLVSKLLDEESLETKAIYCVAFTANLFVLNLLRSCLFTDRLDKQSTIRKSIGDM